MKNAVFLDIKPVALVMSDVSEERIAYNIRVTRIGELGTMLAVFLQCHSAANYC
jgi:hypothetical protein